MKKIMIFIFSITFFSCSKEENTNYTATLINSTQHYVSILFYKNGVVASNDTIKLMPNQSFPFANGSSRGIKIGPSFTTRYFGGPYDSNLVVFDNLYKVAHYATTPMNLSLKYHLNVSLRNIGNAKSYKFESTKISKYAVKNTHEYTFTEDDYLYAK